ncbi:MAG TPA: DUF2269 family protein [Candidatus Limnocylindrales bacterium]|nr:DUF2269 family protein [Candidatus Limnocylindrales bacterium]
MSLLAIILFLHVLGAIVAFGPSFLAFPAIGAMGGKEPMHGNFALRVSETIAKRVWPLALIQGVTGVLLILVGGFDLTKAIWLDVAIVLYLGALAFSYFRQTPTLHKLIEMSSTPPPPPAPGTAPSGPPPAFMALVKQLQQGGMILGLLVVVIVFLMVTKPF